MTTLEFLNNLDTISLFVGMVISFILWVVLWVLHRVRPAKQYYYEATDDIGEEDGKEA